MNPKKSSLPKKMNKLMKLLRSFVLLRNKKNLMTDKHKLYMQSLKYKNFSVA